uniref:Phosphoglucosamine mutase n=1 Tax=Paulinella chromatophora TaxID=39717 RepID=B1X4U3_PAUCH|nr:Phosphotransferase superclass [Paulinella chromatophora]ACB42962.1 Phosphotransferase superclass [Paulinella chromatophora]
MFKTNLSPIDEPHNLGLIQFGTDGIRGCVNSFLTPALALKIGYWFGQVLLSEGPVLIGIDSRNSSLMISSAITAGINASGRDVLSLGLCPTPALPNIIRRFSAAGGIMVSASHNPPQDNGIKVFGSNGAKLNDTQQRTIEAALQGRIEDNITSRIAQRKSSYGSYHQRYDLLEFYRNSLLASVKNKRLDGARIVLDLCCGSATVCSAEVFQALGADLILLNSEPDGSRINVGCGSTNLTPLQVAVTQNSADMGFSFDGDADRVLAVDGRSNIVDGDHILYLWGLDLMKKDELPSNRLVATDMSNLAFEKTWHNLGGIFERTRVGDKYVSKTMEITGAALGGEQSGHIISLQNGMSGDGLLTALKVATLIQDWGGTLSDWMLNSFNPYPQKLVNIHLLNSNNINEWMNHEQLKEIIEKAKLAMNNQGRILIRPSGTEPILRVMVEALDIEMVEYWANKIVKTIQPNFIN